VQDAELFLTKQGIEVTDYFDPARKAPLVQPHKLRVNYENYFFADTEGLERFRQDPGHWCGLVTDPVTKQRFHPGAGKQALAHEGALYYFSSGSSRARFESHPARYALPRFRM